MSKQHQQQELPVAVAQLIDTPTSYHHRELEQRIASVQQELQEKSVQMEGLDAEILALKASAEPLLGNTFINR